MKYRSDTPHPSSPDAAGPTEFTPVDMGLAAELARLLDLRIEYASLKKVEHAAQMGGGGDADAAYRAGWNATYALERIEAAEDAVADSFLLAARIAGRRRPAALLLALGLADVGKDVDEIAGVVASLERRKGVIE